MAGPMKPQAAAEEKRLATVAEAAAASRVRLLQRELDAAKAVHKEATALLRKAQKVAASKSVDGSPDGVKAMPPHKRGRANIVQGPAIQGLPDSCKASLEHRREAAKASMRIFSVGDTVEGKFGGFKSQGAWFRGTVSAVRNDGAGVTYSIDYDDGDRELVVLAKFVRPAHAAAEAAGAPQLSRLAKQPAVPQRPQAKQSSPTMTMPPQPPLNPKPLAPAPKPATAADDFLYNKPWHFSAKHCRQHGCALKHVVLDDFKRGAKSGDRSKLRNAVRKGEIAGTNKVPKPGEVGRPTLRDGWWWHEGGPELTIAKRKFGVGP